MKGPTRLYDAFSGEERFRLFIAAAARGDMQEVERLVRTCPRHYFRGTEEAFRDRLLAARELVLLLDAEVQRWLGWLELLGFIRDVRGQLRVAEPDALSELDGLEQMVSPLEGVIEEHAARQVKSCWAGFVSCVRDGMHVAPRDLLLGLGSALCEPLDALRETLGRVTADPEEEAFWQDVFTKVWDASVKSQP